MKVSWGEKGSEKEEIHRYKHENEHLLLIMLKEILIYSMVK